MSVLINMEMPKTCGDCPIGDTLCCSLMPGVPALWKEYTLALRTNRRHEECPLVPVPPHGRLIDADALMELYADTDDLRLKDMKVPIAVIRQNIMDMPTIIPADQEWEKQYEI